MTRRVLPNPVIAVVSEVLGQFYYNHTRLNILFAEAGAPGDAPPGNCVRKCEQWLKACNQLPDADPYAVLGRVLENFMEVDSARSAWDSSPQPEHPGRQRIRDILARHNLSYSPGGVIVQLGTTLSAPSLLDNLRAKDLAVVEREFQRAFKSAETDPPAAITAACSLLESLLKVYIEDEALMLPSKQTVGDLYKVVRESLSLQPGGIADEDIKRILSGLISVVDGIGALRTHTGSAHGHGRTAYSLRARHARLAIGSAHSLALFILETWQQRSGTRS